MIKQKIHKCIMHNLRLSKIVANNLLITFEFIDHITKKKVHLLVLAQQILLVIHVTSS